MHTPTLPCTRSEQIDCLPRSLNLRLAALLLAATVAGTATAAQDLPAEPQAPTAASRSEITPTATATATARLAEPAEPKAEPKAEPLALALPNGRRLITLSDAGPERLLQILKLLGALALASTACAVMATWLAPRRVPREPFAYPETAAAPTGATVGEVVATGQPWHGSGVAAADLREAAIAAAPYLPRKPLHPAVTSPAATPADTRQAAREMAEA